MRRGLPTIAAVLAILPTGGVITAPAAPLQIGWNDLRPAGDVANASGQTDGTKSTWADGEKLSSDLKGKTIQIAGYALPSDREGDLVYQFLLLPWAGLCSHMPPPPPNQAVLINLKTPYKLSEAYETVSVTGTLMPELEKTQLFILDGVSVIESGYRIAGAQIEPADKVIGAEPQPISNPWSFMRN
ncbi:DUF3299 domain-containing protein [Mesorhizobium sp. BAC0120]|uniref:DUF3299 domain-containing protein n=1 Tax=Mesorhizobium sp. BAC0120 TaxID=3090670 RepID=UPI00298CC2D6|nr:DUF3299 domain-containing protein [Mesorhizobium sp. BAC0120]MDW6023690.1 DUF3299 domain-containing protein [Mesorhizobium sp. BAC0120]